MSINNKNPFYITTQGGLANAAAVIAANVRLHSFQGGQWVVVSAWESVSNISVGANQILVADQSGSVTNAEINDGGVFSVSGNALAKNVVLNNGQVDAVGATIETATVKNGYMVASNGGVVRGATVSGGGTLIASSGGLISETLLVGGKAGIFSGGYCRDMTARTGAEVYVSAGASVSNLVFEGERVRFQVGIAPDTNVQYTSGGRSYQIKNGKITDVTVDANTYFEVYSGGVVSKLHTTGYVEPYAQGAGGAMQLHSGAKAFEVDNHASGQVNVSKGAYLSGAFTDNEAEIYLYGGSADNITIGSSGYVWIHSGGIVNGVNVNGNGGFVISSGGKAVNVAISGGHTIIEESNAHISNVTIRNGGVLEVCGANASGVVISSGGLMTFSSQFYPMDCQTPVYAPNGKAYDVTISSGGVLAVKETASASKVTLNNGGNLQVSSGTEVAGLVVNGGYAGIFEGSEVRNAEVKSGATLEVYSGATYRGYLYIDSGATVAIKGTLDFTLSDRTSRRDYLITNFSKIQGKASYTITVSDKQRSGTYKLAENADSFSGTVTIGNGKVNYGSLTVNGADLVRNGVTYSLDNVAGALTLTVKGGLPEAKVVSGDLDNNGLADVVLVHTKQGYSGSWLSTGTNSLIKWGSLGNVNNGVELVGTGNISGSAEKGQDIFMKIGTTVAAWVVEDGKVKSYKELYNLKSNMNMLGIADFDGDGATDYLLRSKTGDLGYVTGDDNAWHYIQGLGKEWKIAAVGDLDGNGTDDVIVRHDTGVTGAYMIDTNGKITWSNLDTLKSDMTLVGTGDFNGDGVDDVLLQNKSNGWVGAWIVEDGNVDSFIGLCNNKNSIEQISDFNGDGIDDLRIRTSSGDIGVLYVNGADSTTWQYLKSVGKEWDTSYALLS